MGSVAARHENVRQGSHLITDHTAQRPPGLAGRLWTAAWGFGRARAMSSAMSPIQCSITRCELPPSALLRKYVHEGAYTDCYVTEITTSVSLPEYVEAFYTTAVFKLERLILRHLVSKSSSDSDAGRLAHGEIDSFAAWSVEARAPNQLLLCDFQHRTRSWLMVAPIENGGAGTRLYFGSAVVPVSSQRVATPSGQRVRGQSSLHIFSTGAAMVHGST